MGGEYLAVDIGGSSIKLSIAKFNGNRLIIHDKQTFKNEIINRNGHQYIDIEKILNLIKNIVGKLCLEGHKPVSLGIDTFGNGYGILDRDMQLLGLPLFYKDKSTQGNLERIAKKVPLKEIYQTTGVYPTDIRVLMQLFNEVSVGSSRIQNWKHVLLLPDIFRFFLTGEVCAERSMASVASLLDRSCEDWCFDLLEKLSIPIGIFPPLIDSWHGGKCLPFLSEINEELNCPNITLSTVVSHDTESALLAAPMLDERKLFASIGTSVICGVKTAEPIICDDGFRRKFKNVVGAFGKNSLCRDFNGLWILEKCMEYWRRNDPSITYQDVIRASDNAEENHSHFDVCDPSIIFYKGNMPEGINDYFLRTNQHRVNTIGELAKSVFESIALEIKSTFEEVKSLTGRSNFDGISVVGGGVKNDFLIQTISSAVDLPLYKGSSYSSSIGNILMQMYTRRELRSQDDIIKVARSSCDMKVVSPNSTIGKWDAALNRLLMNKKRFRKVKN